MAAFCFLSLMMSHGVKGRQEGNVFRLFVHTKTFLTELALIKVHHEFVSSFSPRSLAAV